MSFRSNLAIASRGKPGLDAHVYRGPANLLSADAETDLRLLEVRMMGHLNRLMALGVKRPIEEAESMLRDLRRLMSELQVGLS